MVAAGIAQSRYLAAHFLNSVRIHSSRLRFLALDKRNFAIPPKFTLIAHA